MATQIFTVENEQFVAGLFWQSLSESNSGDRTNEIKSLAKEISLDLHVLCNTSAHCVGFAKSDLQLKAGAFSAAAIISKSMDVESSARDFIFIAQIPNDQWLYVAQRDGLILPDGDQVFTSEDSAKSRLLEDMSLGEWAVIIAPSIWGVKGANERSFDSFLTRKKNGKLELHKWWRLSHVDSSKSLALHKGKIIIALILIGGSLVGFKYYKDYKFKKEMEAAALAAQQVDAQGRILPPEHPWKTIPAAPDMLDACMTAFSTVRLFPGNWSITAVNCTGGLLTVAWSPNERGWIEHLKIIQPNAVVSTDGSIASISLPLATLNTGYDEPVVDSNLRLVDMYSAAQRYGVKFTATKPSQVAVLPGQSAPATPLKDWNEIAWKVEGSDLPVAVLAALDGDGFRMNAMHATWQNGKFTWNMEGTQYVKP